jgi:hypothetical protein
MLLVLRIYQVWALELQNLEQEVQSFSFTLALLVGVVGENPIFILFFSSR